MPLCQYIKCCHGESEPCLEIHPDPVHDLFEMDHHSQHGEHRLDEYAVIPFAPPTQFEVGRISLGGMEGGVTQDGPVRTTLS